MAVSTILVTTQMKTMPYVFMIQLWQKMFWKCFILNVKFSPFFRGMTLVIWDKNTTFVNEKSVLLISAEHCRI